VALRAKVCLIAVALILIPSTSVYADFWSQLDPFNAHGVFGGWFHPHYHNPGSDLPDVPPPPPPPVGFNVIFTSSTKNVGPIVFYTRSVGAQPGWVPHVLQQPGSAYSLHFFGQPQVCFPNGVGFTEYLLLPNTTNTFVLDNGWLGLYRTL
jgi:hypothetical protein